MGNSQGCGKARTNENRLIKVSTIQEARLKGWMYMKMKRHSYESNQHKLYPRI